MTRLTLPAALAAVSAACGGGGRTVAGAAPVPVAAPAPAPSPPRWVLGDAAPRDSAPPLAPDPVVPPLYAYAAGLMPLASAGLPEFRLRHPTYDGRGVVIGILDSGIDPGVAGLALTSAGAPKILDLRDFSGEGVVPLTPVRPAPDGTVAVAGHVLAGAGRIARITGAATWYAGELRELPLGRRATADLNGNGSNTDVFPVVVVKATDGWVAFLDTNLNGTFDDESPLHDYRQGRETIALGSQPLTLAANLTEHDGMPSLDFVFDDSGHGTHVAGIAAGHNLFNVAGFDGVAPGAQLLGLKVANNARGGVAVTGSIEHAMAYAARYAEQRGLRLALNLSFGVGNELDGHAAIDSIVDAFLLAHPAIVFAISAGNDGPGLSTLGFPGSALLALSTGAALPGAFTEAPPLPDAPHPPSPPPPADIVGWWSARGGELAKPDLITPGVAFSTVPPFDRGREVKGGTSMAAPYAVGLAACLISGIAQEGRAVSAVEIGQALRVSASPLAGGTLLDQGAGEPRLEAAYRWLEAGHQGSQYSVRTSRGAAAAFRRDGLASPGDTVEVFRVRHLTGLRAAQFALRSNVSWLQVPATLAAAPLETAIPVRYVPGRFTAPGVYTGVVHAWNPNDSVAGPLFALLATVVVPYDLGIRPLVDAGRLIGPAQVQRYFLRVAHPGATLETTVTLGDSGGAPPPTVRLYEPTGQPFRDADEQLLGPRSRGATRLVVRGEDLVPGVYELDVIATPRAAVTTSVSAAIAPLVLEENEGALEATNLGPATVVARVTALLLGAVREFDVTGREAPAESLSVRVPAWASQALIDVALPRGQWSELTGFGVTEFDSMGQQVGQGPLNYPTGRQPLDVTALRGRPLLIELAPAFARAAGAHSWRATVRVRFLLEHAQSWDGAGRVSVVSGGRVRVPVLVPAASPLPLPQGFRLLVETRLHAENVPESPPDAVRR